jgi:hypothetical protein
VPPPRRVPPPTRGVELLSISREVTSDLAEDLRSRHYALVVNPSVVANVPQPHALSNTPLKPSTESASPFDVRPVVETLTRALTATPQLRAADTAAGMALIAVGTRSRHPMSAAVFVGVHAIQPGLGRKSPSAWSTFEIQPDIGRGRFAITVRRTIGEPRGDGMAMTAGEWRVNDEGEIMLNAGPES